MTNITAHLGFPRFQAPDFGAPVGWAARPLAPQHEPIPTYFDTLADAVAIGADQLAPLSREPRMFDVIRDEMLDFTGGFVFSTVTPTVRVVDEALSVDSLMAVVAITAHDYETVNHPSGCGGSHGASTVFVVPPNYSLGYRTEELPRLAAHLQEHLYPRMIWRGPLTGWAD